MPRLAIGPRGGAAKRVALLRSEQHYLIVQRLPYRLAIPGRSQHGIARNRPAKHRLVYRREPPSHSKPFSVVGLGYEESGTVGCACLTRAKNSVDAAETGVHVQARAPA